ncbi:MAG: DsrE/DsrF/DrsH-like family protein [Actinomycetota bacterium]
MEMAAPIQPDEEEEEKKLVIVASSGSLEDTWAALIIATAGAAMGMRTTIFFTFWGLFALVRNDVKRTGTHWMQKMVGRMNRGGTDHLKLSKMNFAGMGPKMIKTLARRYKDASPTELLEAAQDMGVHLIPCQMTMELMGLKNEDMIEGLEEPIGATTMLLEAQGAVTFFM